MRLRLVVPAGGTAALAAAWASSHRDGDGASRGWTRLHHTLESPTLSVPLAMRLDAQKWPPPIGCADWPAGRVLLQWALDHLPADATTLEIGSGIGTAAIGMACANASRGESVARIFATDIDEEALALCRANAALNGVGALPVSRWDAAAGAPSVAALPVEAAALTHVIAADLVYSGGCDEHTVQEEAAAGPGLPATLAALCREQPRLEVTIVHHHRAAAAAPINALDADVPLHDRGASFGDDHRPLVAFERACRAHGLRAERRPLPAETVARVCAGQSAATRLQWFLGGTWDKLVMYRIVLDEGGSG